MGGNHCLYVGKYPQHLVGTDQCDDGGGFATRYVHAEPTYELGTIGLSHRLHYGGGASHEVQGELQMGDGFGICHLRLYHVVDLQQRADADHL